MEIMPEDRKEEETDISSTVTYSDDADAKWIKKGKRAYYGYYSVSAFASGHFNLSEDIGNHSI